MGLQIGPPTSGTAAPTPAGRFGQASAYLTPSGADDSVAMATALTSFAPFAFPVIMMGPGVFQWNTRVPGLLRNTPAVIAGAGTDKTKILLTSGAPRAFDFTKVADYDLFANIEIRDLTVDCNNLAGFHHTVLGVYQAGAHQTLLSFDHIALRRIKTVNVPSCQTLGSVNVSVNHRFNVFLASWHPNANITTPGDQQTVCTNILCEDCDFQGGNVGIAVTGSGGGSAAGIPTVFTGSGAGADGALAPGTYYYRVFALDATGSPSYASAEIAVTLTAGQHAALSWTAPAGASGTYQVWRGDKYGRENVSYTVAATTFNDVGAAGTSGRLPIGVNCFIDNVVFNRCRWTALGILTSYAPQEGFQIGSLGFGGSYLIRDCYAYGSGDNGFEVDGHSYALLDNCTADGIGGASIDGYTLTGFSTPLDEQETIYRNCRARAVGPDTALGAVGIPRGWGIKGLDATNSAPGAYVGTVTLQGCRMFDNTPTLGANGRLVFVLGDLPKLRLLDVRYVAVNKTVTLTQNVNEEVIEWTGNNAGNLGHLVMRDVDLAVDGSITVGGFSCTWNGLFISNCTIALDIDDFNIGYVMPGTPLHGFSGIQIPDTVLTVLARSVIRRYRPSQTGDAGPRGILLGGTNHLTIADALIIEDADFTNLAGTPSQELAFNTPSNVSSVFLIRPRMHPGAVVFPSALTVTASPFSYTNLDNYPEWVTVQGGTVSAVTITPDGSHITNVGVTSGIFRLDNNDSIGVTYTGLPTMNKIPISK